VAPTDDKWLIRMRWDGAVLRPFPDWLRLAREFLTEDEQYMVTVAKERSVRSHNHFFAAVQEAWLNLPEGMATQVPTFHHLRKFALIKTGHCHSETFVMTTPGDALRLAAALRRQRDEFTIITVTGCAVVRYAAKSQSEKAMGAKEFQASKQAVIDYLASLVGISADQLKAEAGQSA